MSRILVIDDEPNIRMVLDLVLSSHGHEVEPAENGLAGLQKLADGFEPDVVLVDLKMPLLSGKDMVLKMRDNPQYNYISVLILSGSLPGFGDFPPSNTYQGLIAKPFDLDELCELVEACCQKDKLLSVS